MRNRRERKAIEATQKRQTKKVDRLTKSTQAVLQTLEASSLRAKLRICYQLLTSARTRLDRANRKALGIK